MQKLFLFIAILCLFSSCKKTEFQKCIKEYESHDYKGVLSCDSTSFQFDEVLLSNELMSDEMSIRPNGFSDDGFVVRVSDDCSFVVLHNANEKTHLILPNSDTLFIQSGSGTKVDDNTISLTLETESNVNCTFLIEKK